MACAPGCSPVLQVCPTSLHAGEIVALWASGSGVVRALLVQVCVAQGPRRFLGALLAAFFARMPSSNPPSPTLEVWNTASHAMSRTAPVRLRWCLARLPTGIIGIVGIMLIHAGVRSRFAFSLFDFSISLEP